MALPLYVVNAFSDAVFGGNPAAVVPLDEWLPDTVLQSLAAQHNLSETAFLVPEGDAWQLRWFTPAREVDLCGHATLASAYVLRTEYGVTEPMEFHTRSGVLRVTSNADGQLSMDFPAIALETVTPEPAVIAALGCSVIEAARPVENPWQWLYRVADQRVVESLAPDFAALAKAADYGVIVSAEGENCDFVSRFFIPSLGINEDPVTGSAHCLLTPFWSARLGKTQLRARQCSARGGTLHCDLQGQRVHLSGSARLYARGEIVPALSALTAGG